MASSAPTDLAPLPEADQRFPGAACENNNGEEVAELPSPTYSNLNQTGDGPDHRLDVPPDYSQGSFIEPPPPSYESIFGKLKKIQKEAVGDTDCADRFSSTLISVVLRTVAFVTFMGVPGAMVVIGVLYREDCPAKRMVPVYLIVAGSTACFYFITIAARRLYRRCERRGGEPPAGGAVVEDCPPHHPVPVRHRLWKVYNGLMTTFIIGWFLVGNYFVYNAWVKRPCADAPTYSRTPLNCDEEMATFCDPLLLTFSFWVITSIYITCGCCTCSSVCVGCAIACHKSRK